jgi:uncharacterized protein (TIGR00255 family)
MTGFGSAEGPAAGGRIRIDVRTVNHRHLNLALKVPGDLAPLEGDLRESLRRAFDRGHIGVSALWVEPPPRGLGGFSVNLERARAVVTGLTELKSRLGLAGEVDLAMVLRQPDVVSPGAGEEVAVTWPEIEPTLARAVAECKATRRREGNALAAELAHRLSLLEAAAGRIAGRAPERLVKERDRLRAAVSQLLEGRATDEQRLAQEIAFLADRLDITEELVRFSAHLAACRQILARDGPVGKELGFLVQELGRETNTMGSKANDGEIAQQVIAMKGELEKFREQLENLE